MRDMPGHRAQIIELQFLNTVPHLGLILSLLSLLKDFQQPLKGQKHEMGFWLFSPLLFGLNYLEGKVQLDLIP
jgi:hypothetical protein